MTAFKLNFNNAFQEDLESVYNSSKKYLKPYIHTLNKGQSLIASVVSPGGNPEILDNIPREKKYSYCPIASEVPVLKKISEAIPGIKYSVRLMVFPKNTGVKLHVDNFKSFRHGVVRLHVPLAVDPKFKFVVDGKTIKMGAGELWYGDFSLPHYVFNWGKTDHCHLVLDVGLNDELLDIFPKSIKTNSAFCIPAEKKTKLNVFKIETVFPSILLPLGVQKNKFIKVQIYSDTKSDCYLKTADGHMLKLIPVSRYKFHIYGTGNHFIEFEANNNKVLTRAIVKVEGFNSQNPVSKKFELKDIHYAQKLNVNEIFQ